MCDFHANMVIILDRNQKNSKSSSNNYNDNKKYIMSAKYFA